MCLPTISPVVLRQGTEIVDTHFIDSSVTMNARSACDMMRNHRYIDNNRFL